MGLATPTIEPLTGLNVGGRNGGWHEGGEYVGIGIGQAIYQLPAMWRAATGEDLFAREPAIRGFLTFVIHRALPDGTIQRWGDVAFPRRRVDDALAAAVSLCRDHGGTVPKVSGAASAPAASDTWKSSFIRMPYQRDALARHSVMAETFETSMTWDRMEHFIASVQESARAIVQQVTGTPGIVTCRLTHVYPDGAAPYFGIYAPGSWDGIVSQWDEMKAAVSETLHTLGGTITHHHAVGRDHRPWYDRQRPDVFAAAVRGAKSALDPAGILNPGIMVD